MKRSLKTMLGVTLLEIMLVLAIAALIIIMSIRFYGSASTSNKVNAAQSAVQGVVAAVESYITSGGSVATVSATTIAPYLPGGKMPTSPFDGAVVTIAPGTLAAGTYTVNIDVPGAPATGSTAVVGSPCSQFELAMRRSGTMTVTCSGSSAAVLVSIYGVTGT